MFPKHLQLLSSSSNNLILIAASELWISMYPFTKNFLRLTPLSSFIFYPMTYCSLIVKKLCCMCFIVIRIKSENTLSLCVYYLWAQFLYAADCVLQYLLSMYLCIYNFFLWVSVHQQQTKAIQAKERCSPYGVKYSSLKVTTCLLDIT